MALPAERAPRLRQAAAEWLPALDLADMERRFCGRRLDGSEPGASLCRTGGLSETGAARLLCLLHLCGLLEWIALAPAAAAPPADEVRGRYEKLSGGDLFVALGLHYSVAPAAIRVAYQTIMGEHGPGSAAQQRSPEYAARIVALAEQAFAVLGRRESRQRYRQEVLRVNVAAAAKLTADQAKLAALRGDTARARELLAAALDLCPTPEYLEAWRSLARGGDADLDPDTVAAATHPKAERP